jgi:hypothetical protein
MAKDRMDFINVRLSAAALDLHGHAERIRIINAHCDYIFTGDSPVEVVRRGEWDMLRHHLMQDGSPMFQEATAQPLVVNEPTESEDNDVVQSAG